MKKEYAFSYIEQELIKTSLKHMILEYQSAITDIKCSGQYEPDSSDDDYIINRYKNDIQVIQNMLDEFGSRFRLLQK